MNINVHNVFLFDCDTKRQNKNNGNVHMRVMKTYDNPKKFNKGIENSLILDEIDITNFYTTSEKDNDYGSTNTIREFQKMKFCDYICSLDNIMLQKIFSNLKTVIEEMIEICR